MRISVSMSESLNEAWVSTQPNWVERIVLGEVPREFYALRAPDIGGGFRWWDNDRRRYIDSARLNEALHRAWWSADLDERRAAVRRTLDRKVDEMREQIRAM